MSPRRKDPELAERRREALVKAGYAEILEKGIQAVTIDSVVARAGSSKGGALYYFHTKDELLYGVLEWLLAEMSHALDEIAEGGGSARARLASLSSTMKTGHGVDSQVSRQVGLVSRQGGPSLGNNGEG